MLSDEMVEQLHQQALAVREKAYCPYSNFRVGAAVLCDDDTIYTGCNVENASHTVATCAERTAICKAISEGKRHFKAIFVVGSLEKEYTSPCGACRQLLAEFGLNWEVIMAKPGSSHRRVLVKDLLPFAFSFL